MKRHGPKARPENVGLIALLGVMFVLSKDIPLFSGIARAWSEVEVIDKYKDASGQVLLNVKADGKEIHGLVESSVMEKKQKDPF